MSAEFRIYLNNNPADDARLNQFSEVRVDLAMGICGEAELTLEIGADRDGNWEAIEEDFTQPFARIRVEVKPRKGDEFEALIDGPIVSQRFELDARPNRSQMVLVVHDDSVLLNRSEAVVLYADQTASQIAATLYAEADFAGQVDDVQDSGGGLERSIMQRGTAMQLLRELARRHGMYAYVEPAPEVGGQSVGAFRYPDFSEREYPELLLMGRRRNVNQFKAEYDALRPVSARAASINIADKSVLEAQASAGTSAGLGTVASHEIATPGAAMLARTREDSNDLQAAVDAVAEHSSWAYRAELDVAANIYPAVLRPYRVISVAGPGSYLGGDYLISRVSHRLSDGGYEQKVTLRRNGRSGGGTAAGLVGEVF